MTNAPDEDDFTAMYTTFYRPVFRYALVARGPDDADDVVSETFRKAYLAWNGQGVRPRSPLAWLLTIARRTVIDADRRDRRRPVARMDGYDGGSDELQRGRETWLWFESVTRDLPENARHALYLRYASALPDDEIAVALGMSASGVRSAISRGLASIRAAELEQER